MESISTENNHLIEKLIISILLGLLVGLEREHSNKFAPDKNFGGIRTYPILAIFGFLSAFISSILGTYSYIVFFTILGFIIGISYYVSSKDGFVGGTTELTIFIVFILGSLVFFEKILISTVVAVILVGFLSLRKELHELAGKVHEEDIFATLKFGIVTLVILPILPDKEFGPLLILNPKHIWYMVVLIAGISFVGYVLFKLVGVNRGIQLMGILGGIVSSTATALSFTEKSKESPEFSKNFAAAIILASTIMFPRILLVVYILDEGLGKSLSIPVAIITSFGVGSSLLLWYFAQGKQNHEIQINNPFKILTAVKFGFIFGVILFISRLALVFLGNEGVYFTAILGGCADVDAVALSMTKLVKDNISQTVATNAILLACLANTTIKASITVFMGSPELKKYTIPGFSAIGISLVVYLVFTFV